eukprot:6856755-Prymnesium_polylepis.1
MPDGWSHRTTWDTFSLTDSWVACRGSAARAASCGGKKEMDRLSNHSATRRRRSAGCSPT